MVSALQQAATDSDAWTFRRIDARLSASVRAGGSPQGGLRRLGDELGIAPVRATTELFDAIRTGTLEASGARRGSTVSALPLRSRGGDLPLVGRDEALALIVGATTGGRSVTVTGETGVGRSRFVEAFVAAHPAALVARAHSGEAALSLAPLAELMGGG